VRGGCAGVLGFFVRGVGGGGICAGVGGARLGGFLFLGVCVCVLLVVFVGAGWSACSWAVVVAQGANLFGVDRKTPFQNLVVHCFVLALYL
jgi:hypothetical protein